MRKVVLSIFLICGCVSAHSQINLLHNPSFETHWRCPQYHDLVKYANYWSDIEDTTTNSIDTLGLPPYLTDCKPEYCHVCSSYPYVMVPSSSRYTHSPRTGEGMMSVQMFYNDEDTTFGFKRDYLQGRLKKTLVNGEQYCVTFFTCLTGGSAYAVNKVGAYFDDASLDTASNCGTVQSLYTPQVYTNTINSDTVSWTKVQDIFTAGSAQRFITIGNFFYANTIDSVRLHFPMAATWGNNITSFYLIDDVSVIKVGTVAFAGNDTTIHEGDTMWLGEHVNYVGDSVWHNDFDDYAPVKWYTATGALIDSNHSGLQVHPATTTKYVMELDVCGTLSYDTITVTVIPVGIDGVQTLGAVKVWPNPATNVLHVSGVAGSASYRLVNAVGVTMMQGVVDGQIDIGRLSKGVYVLELLSGEGERRCVRVLKL